MSDEERKKISNILRKKRLHGKTSGMWKDVGIPYLVKIGKWNDLYNWEKKHFLYGDKKGLWDKKGNYLKK